VNGPREAFGHARARLGSIPLPGADLAGARADDVAKDSAEGAETPPAGLECDVGDGQIAVAQQRRGTLDPAREQIAVRRHAERVLERAGEVGCGYAADLREARHRPVFVRGGVDRVLGTQQAADQRGVLGHARGCSLVRRSSSCRVSPSMPVLPRKIKWARQMSGISAVNARPLLAILESTKTQQERL
jgi:hypothetical protein